MKKLIYILPLLFLSCSVFQKINPDKKGSSKEKTTVSVTQLTAEIGAIGISEGNLINKKFQINTFPILKQKVRLSAIDKNFNKSTLKQLKKVQVVDSVNTPSKYLELKIIDKVILLEELNTSHNKNVYKYLKNTGNSSIITSVSLVFSKEIQDKINSTEEVYLTGNSNNDLVLELYKDGKLTGTVHLANGNTFDYTTSGFCWRENDKKNIVITDITNKKCSKNSFESYTKASKKKEEFKF